MLFRFSGGLVGRAQGNVIVATTYADSYVDSNGDASGLVGSIGDGVNVSFEECYAAGFVTGTNTAGVACGPVTKLDNTYTICSSGSDTLTYSMAQSAASANDSYFMFTSSNATYNARGTDHIGSMDKNALYGALGGNDSEFTTETSNATHAYNFKGQALSTYEYPRLKANPITATGSLTSCPVRWSTTSSTALGLSVSTALTWSPPSPRTTPLWATVTASSIA